jgi:hypothetical protein
VDVNDGAGETQNLYAWIAADASGVEGISTVGTNSGLLPLVVSDLATAQSMREVAAMVGQARGTSTRLIRFARSEVIDEIDYSG